MDTATDELSAHYGDLLDTSPDALVVVTGGRIALVNLQTERLFGYPRSELVGAPVDLLIPERFREVHTAHVERFLEAPAVRSMGSGLELRGRRRDGTEVPIEVSLSLFRATDRVIVSASIRDISYRKMIEAKARLGAERLISAVENIQDGFALFDADERLVLSNATFRALVREPQGDPVGRSFEELFDVWLEGVESVEAERAGSKARRFAHREDGALTLDVETRDRRNLRVMARRTAEGGIVETVWDVTEDERRAKDLLEARNAADVANAAKSEFLSSMSHELRTPLNAILGFAQLLQRDKREPLGQRQRERADEIIKGGEHLLRLINDILDLSRIEAGGVSISTEPVTLMEVLEEVKTMLAPAALEREIRIAVLSPAFEVPSIHVDRTRFAQIVMNYGSNAIKYNRRGGTVTIGISMTDQGRVRITVADDGLGIPADKQDKLFQPFQRAGQEMGTIEGTGIGLAVTKRLAELMNGSVGFRSVPSEGSSFWVDVPVHTSSIRPPSSRPPLDAPAVSGRRCGVVLYVEDNPSNVTLMKHLLDGFEAIELIVAGTAEDGVQIARRRVPDVVIMDVNLPGMDGLAALRELRKHPETRHVQVIALSAAATERDRKRGEAAGFRHYLAKPVRVAELEAALEGLLGN